MITQASDLQNNPQYNALVASEDLFQQFSSTLAKNFADDKSLPAPLNDGIVRKLIAAAPTQYNANIVVNAILEAPSSGKLERRDLSFTRLYLIKFMHSTTGCSDGTSLQDPGIPLDSSIVRRKEGEIFLDFCAEAGNVIHLQKYSSVWFPTPLLHQNLFFPSTDKPAMLDHVLFSSSWGTIEFTGPRLSIYHETFFFHLLRQVTHNYSGSRITYVGSKRDFVRDILRAMYPETSYYGGSDEERIMGYLEDLSKASFCFVKKDPKTGEIKGRSDPITFLRYECSGRDITIAVDRYFIPTGRKGFTLVNLDLLHILRGNITKILYLFLKSHSLNPDWGSFNADFMKVARALLLVQDGDDPDANRKQQINWKIKESLHELKELGLISEDSGAYAKANTVGNETFEDLIRSSGMNTTSDLAAPDPRTGSVRNAKELRVKNALSPLAFFLLFTLACFFLATKKTTVFVKISHLYAFFKDNVCFRFFARELNYAMGQLIRRGILLETSSMGTTKANEFVSSNNTVTLSITKAFAKRCEESFDKKAALETIAAVLAKQEHLVPDDTQQQKVKVSKKTRKPKDPANEMANAAKNTGQPIQTQHAVSLNPTGNQVNEVKAQPENSCLQPQPASEMATSVRSEAETTATTQEKSPLEHTSIAPHSKETAQCRDVRADSSCQEQSPDLSQALNQVNQGKVPETSPLPQPASEMATSVRSKAETTATTQEKSPVEPTSIVPNSQESAQCQDMVTDSSCQDPTPVSKESQVCSSADGLSQAVNQVNEAKAQPENSCLQPQPASEMATSVRSEAETTATTQEKSPLEHTSIVPNSQESAQCQDMVTDSSCQDPTPVSKESQVCSSADGLSQAVNQVNETKVPEAGTCLQLQPASEMANAAKNVVQPIQTKQPVSLDHPGLSQARKVTTLLQPESDREMATSVRSEAETTATTQEKNPVEPTSIAPHSKETAQCQDNEAGTCSQPQTASEMANAAKSEAEATATTQEKNPVEPTSIAPHSKETAQCQDVRADSSCQEQSPDLSQALNQVNQGKVPETSPLLQPASEMANAAKNVVQPIQTKQAVSLNQTGNQANKKSPGTSFAGGYVVVDKDAPLLRYSVAPKRYSTIPQASQNISISISCTSKGWGTNPGKSTTRNLILQPQTMPVQGFLDLSVAASLMNQTLCSGVDFLRTGGSRVLDQMVATYKNPFVRFQDAAGMQL